MRGQHLENPDIARIFRGETISGLSEWQLLQRYLERRDELAFEALVARHGPMVLGVCRRMLAEESDVEDAFQATFLVLVRRARQLGPRDLIGAWLHGVAARVALRARSRAARRRLQPMPSNVISAGREGTNADREAAEILDQELGRLPDKYRNPVVLCYLEGQTHEEAARQLRWPVGTVKGRLSRARDLLRSRLARRGLAPGIGALTALIARDGSAACSRALLERTVKSSLAFSRGRMAAGAASAQIAALAQGVLRSMVLNRLKWAGVAVLVSGLALSGGRVIARQNFGPRQNDTPVLRKPPAEAAADSVARTDAFSLADRPAAGGDVKDSPPTLERLLQQYIRAARNEWQTALKEYMHTGAALERAYLASRRLMDAESSAAPAAAKADATQSHFDRMRELARIQVNHPAATELQAAQIGVYAAEAELWLADVKAQRREQAAAPVDRTAVRPERAAILEEPRPESGTGSGDGRGKDPQSRRILAKLAEPVMMNFPKDTPLDEVLKHVRTATRSSEFPTGLPIYIDPAGLKAAEKTLNSTVLIDLDGVPLRRTLQLVLAQLGLVYLVDDGMLYITSEPDDAPLKLEPPIPEVSPLMMRVEQAQRGELTVGQMKDLIELLKTREVLRKHVGLQDVWGGEGPPPVPPAAAEEAKRTQELVELLIKETRALVVLLRAEKQAKKPADAK
jgi:RNA polymerase sigma factor (sigma-70 family)